MHNLADVFAFFYSTDLANLDRVINEGIRIRNERRENPSRERHPLPDEK